MALFNDAIGITLQHEGGYSNNPADPGGSTMYGITQSYIDGLVSQGKIDGFDVKNMTMEQAKIIYETYWWNAYGYGNIVDQTVANKVFDESVNVGPGRMHKIVQQVCCDLGSPVTVDGQLGSASYAAINSIDPADMLSQLKIALVNYYTLIVQEHPTMSQFLHGWTNRANS